MTRIVIDSPVGPLRLTADAAGLREIRFLGKTDPADRAAATGEATAGAGLDSEDGTGAPVLAEAVRQLGAYFAGELRELDLPLAPRGTPFQLAVWRALTDVRYGETTSYGELAARIGRPRAVRAVGAANGANPLPIVVPCHRVIGADGSLTGYGGGLPVKRALLALERGPGPPKLPFD
jgi:methylated-DNA-[protein]-cysteine S-methyltransferase